MSSGGTRPRAAGTSATFLLKVFRISGDRVQVPTLEGITQPHSKTEHLACSMAHSNARTGTEGDRQPPRISAPPRDRR